MKLFNHENSANSRNRFCVEGKAAMHARQYTSTQLIPLKLTLLRRRRWLYVCVSRTFLLLPLFWRLQNSIIWIKCTNISVDVRAHTTIRRYTILMSRHRNSALTCLLLHWLHLQLLWWRNLCNGKMDGKKLRQLREHAHSVHTDAHTPHTPQIVHMFTLYLAAKWQFILIIYLLFKLI